MLKCNNKHLDVEKGSLMSIKEQLTKALINAMKSGDKEKKLTVRMILSNIKNAEIDNRKPLEEDKIILLLYKEIKMRKDSLDAAIKADRQDLIKQSNNEIVIIKSFLPESLSQAELEVLVRGVIEEVGATSIKDMGNVMKTLLPRLKGRASSAEASKIVRTHLK